MKNLLVLFGLALIMASCGSSKQMTQTPTPTPTPQNQTPKRVKVENEECEDEASKKSDFLRGYGMGTDADKMFARDIATATARNEIVKAVQASVSSMLTKFNEQHSNAISRESISKANGMIKSIAEETLNGARVICSNTYMVGQQYEVHVCVELTNVDFTKKTYDKLAKDEKLLIDYKYEQYKEDMNKELEEYRKRKQ